MRTFFLLFIYFFYLLVQVFRMIKLKFLYKFKGKEIAEKYTDKVLLKWVKVTNKIFGVKIRVHGRENIPNQACVFIGNHQSNFDITALIEAANLPMGFISKKEVLKVPVIGYWMKAIHCVGMDRENVREAVKVFKEGSDNIKNGHNMTIFPEGTRAKDGVMKDFKQGSFKLATKAKAPIIPVTISGTNKAYELEGKLRKATVDVTFHKPIYTAELSKEDEKNLAEKIQKIVKSAL
ncbi:lysophospholipid acyltransferase family protein [Inconstantimicrobium mannanitabidum]|uniref:1-acyl-sn-glycerol-3-phosphate acyltransferase n=1 Tax=Inconstantimicrobium mannanitabidum TaxID=1604901 RepID=A0ACB5RC77_9CLOT|nr:lysophospholipid acyltransferase family protein [Clostridium sp. TW13]GKX66777.1 1-acyl-sn-glycerol-3-phosphate acyltransferase [Clostridium sp. TW13]